MGARRLLMMTGLLAVAGCRCGEAPGPVTVEYVQPGPEDASTPLADPSSEAAADARVIEATGRVQVKRGTAADWSEVKVGDRLGEADSVRTFDDAQVEIEVSDIRVSVEERSELWFRTIREKEVRANIRGRIASKVPENEGNALELQVEGTDAVVRSTGGSFAINADGRGTVAVATVSGKVDFSARGRTVTVAAGEVTHQIADAPPEKPRNVAQRVMLSVQWPGVKETNLKVVPVRGVVEVGSRVRVQGQYVEVDRNGRFVARVSLKQGEQTVAVVATDVLGRRAQERTQLIVDRKAPTVDRKNRPWE